MASDTDTSAQQLTTSDALAYLKCVKDLFKDNKEKYNEFLEVMRGFKSQRINTYEVIMKVQELFKGHSDLILGFSKFLPNGYKIKPADFHEAFNFVSKIKSRFENDQLIYRSFLNTLEMYRNHTKSSSEVRWEVALLFKNLEDLFMEFLHFLPDTSTSTAQLVSPGRRFARRDKFRTMKPPCMQKIQDRDMDREHEKKDANMTVESVKHRENKQINQGSPDVSKDVANHKVSLSPSIMDYKDLDLSNCPSCTPSYRLLPENCRAPVSSHRTELDKSVLNDVWVSVTSGTSSNASRKSQYEESLFKCEDDRYELDMLVELANTTVEKVQNLVKKMQDDNDINKLESPNLFFLKARNLNCIKRVYGDIGFDVVDALKKMLVLPLILDRLKQKQEEWTSCRANFNKVCYQASKDDIAVYTTSPSADYVNVYRWYNHIEALLSMRYVSGEGQGMKVDGSTTISKEVPASQPIANTKAPVDQDDDDDIDLFGKETEEEKKAVEEREATVKASRKKKESGKSSILLDVKPWDDETDMQKLEAAVRSVKMEGLLWGASKLVPVGYGIKKLQIMFTIVDDLVSVDNLIEDHLTAEPANEYIQSCDIVVFNKIYTDTSAQKLTISDALAYLKYVKDLFKDNKEKYNEFLKVMRDFKSQRINTYEVIMKVQELFKGHSDLILGFGKFLPNGYETKVPEEKKPADFHEAFNFVSKIKSRFQNDQLTYRSFLDTLEMYRNHTKSSSEVLREVALLFKNHEDLFMEFLHFLPDTSTSTAQLVSPGRRFARRDKFKTMKPPCMQKIQDRDMDREHEKKDANMTVESVKHRKNKQINQGSPDVSKDVANHKVSLSPSIMDYKDLDLSNCPSCTPSYRLLPKNCRAPVSSDRTELDKSVLNDVWVSVTSGTEDYSSNPSRKSQYEKSLFKCEDDRYELDMLVELANTTVEKVQNLVNKMQDDINKLESPFRIEDHLTSRNLYCIERLYGDNGFNVMDALNKNASVAFPLILDRLKQKQEEWISCRANFNKLFLLRSKKSIRRKSKN
ncbi:hypothetical protein KFK09_003384 [Dendrobium nobile]|uniref:Uncharacterized protein n=1 Tax=Dendrobium nobile TaxID=94219 RepID=A0A8T3C143_DENNO|nr:hypothetical protein KFK09_003384 [Dendrobium nobile]